MSAGNVLHGAPFDARYVRQGRCLIWQGPFAANGTGIYYSTENGTRPGKGGKSTPAHRYALARSLGRPIEPDSIVKQVCGNRLCVAPAHLVEVTLIEFYGLDGNKVVEIRELVAARNSIRSVADKYGLTRNTVSRIARGEHWASFGGPITRQEDLKVTHCKHGHAWTEENTLFNYYYGTKRCRTCTRDAARRRRAPLRTP